MSPIFDYFPVPQRLLLRSAILLLPAISALACPPLPPQSAAALPLSAVLDRVPACHPDVRAAERVLAASTADITSAGEAPNPQLTMGAGSVGSRIGSGSPWNKTLDHSLRIDQLFERGGKRALRRAVAEAQRDAARAALAEARRQGLLGATRAFYDLVAALSRREQTAAGVALNEESLQALERRVRAGDAAPLDATRFAVDALRLQADLKQADADVRSQRLQLAALIGAEAQAEALTPVAVALRSRDQVIETEAVLERRPDLVAAQARLSAAEQARDLARSQRTRDVSAGVQLDHWPVSDSNPSGTGNTLSVSVSVPLMLRHNYEGEVARAEADVNTGQEALWRAQLAARSDLDRARARWQAAEARRRLVVEQLLPAAERLAAGAEFAYRRGATGALDVLDARRSLNAARIERINADADLAKAAAELDAARQPIDYLLKP